MAWANLFSVYNALQAIGAQAEITSDPEQLKQADGIILPGVGAFRDCMRNLEQIGLIDTIKSEAAQGKPLLGICLGMQVLFEKGYEVEECAGLGLLQGEIRLMEDPDVKIPHIGWSRLGKSSIRTPSCKKGSIHSYTMCILIVRRIIAMKIWWPILNMGR